MEDNQVDPADLDRFCSQSYEIAAKILDHLHEQEGKELAESISKLSDKALSTINRLMYTAAKLSKTEPGLGEKIYLRANCAKAAVLDALNMIESIARVKVIHRLISSHTDGQTPTQIN